MIRGISPVAFGRLGEHLGEAAWSQVAKPHIEVDCEAASVLELMRWQVYRGSPEFSFSPRSYSLFRSGCLRQRKRLQQRSGQKADNRIYDTVTAKPERLLAAAG